MRTRRTRTIWSSTTNSPPPDWDTTLRAIGDAIGVDYEASVNRVAREHDDPLRVLVSTVISLRTRDEVTFAASERLFALAPTARDLMACPPDAVAAAIYPAGFYRTKARQLIDIARRIEEEYGGDVPRSLEDLLALPGVGRKTANLVLGLGFGVAAICVDTHVHRIPNRCGWIATRTPDETEVALAAVLPERHWIEINQLLVGFGQQICTPQSPWCSRCPIADACMKVGVERSR